MIRSAGILPYKIVNNELFVLVGHMGGPYYPSDRNGSYSIIKGQIEENESIEDAAVREFYEETSQKIDHKDIHFIGTTRQRPGKEIIIFGIEKDFDVSNWKSNTFEMEWPLHSGNKVTFPEMDGYFWFPIDVALEKSIVGQAPIFRKLKQFIKEKQEVS